MKQKCLACAHGVFHLSESSSLQQVPHSYLKKFVHNRPLGMIRKQIKSRYHKLPELEIQINLKKKSEVCSKTVSLKCYHLHGLHSFPLSVFKHSKEHYAQKRDPRRTEKF